MSTSGQSSFNPVLDQVIRRALRMIGAFASNDNPTPNQRQDALEVLNMLLKSWQIDGFSWLKTFAQVQMVVGQNYYYLGPAGTAKYLPANTTVISRPTRVFEARRSASGIEVPLTRYSRKEYAEMPNKTVEGTVTQFYYDPQMVNGVLYVWPTPQTADYILMTVDRTVQDMLADTETFDLPQEWGDSLAYCLAERLWFEYPDNPAMYQLLAQRASAAKEHVMQYDREYASTYIQRANI